MKHITVLKQEAIEALSIRKQSCIVDATYGGGGHAQLICEQLGPKGIFVGIDADKTAFNNTFKAKEKGPKLNLVENNFANLEQILSSLNIKKVDGILADLGWRSDQFEEGGKGFSFKAEEPLLMTYGDPEGYIFTAHDLVNSWDETNIADIIYGYGEERHSRRIAKGIVEARTISEIKTAKELADIIEASAPSFYRHGRTHAATKTFQAIRIAVNNEFGRLDAFISAALDALAPDGRLVIISFHSLEDRIVKLRFREAAATKEFKLVIKKPLVASAEELKANPRSRSAKLRILERIS